MEANIKIRTRNKSKKDMINEVLAKLNKKFKETDDLVLLSYKKNGSGKNATIHLKYTTNDRIEGRKKNDKNIQTNGRRQKINREKSKNSKRRKQNIFG